MLLTVVVMNRTVTVLAHGLEAANRHHDRVSKYRADDEPSQPVVDSPDFSSVSCPAVAFSSTSYSYTYPEADSEIEIVKYAAVPSVQGILTAPSVFILSHGE